MTKVKIWLNTRKLASVNQSKYEVTLLGIKFYLQEHLSRVQ